MPMTEPRGVATPVAEEIRETILGTVLTLVEDLLGRELELADSPVLDAIRRALTFCPSDAPAVVRVHPDDLAEVPAEALAALPATVRVVGDASIERTGAIPVPPAMKRKRRSCGASGNVKRPTGPRSRSRCPR